MRRHIGQNINNKSMMRISFILISVGVLSILAWIVITPTTNIVVNNDTNRAIQASVCGSNPATIGGHQRVNVDASSNDPNEACAIYDMSDHYLGCLPVPTNNGKTAFKVSSLDENTSEKNCGD